MKNTPKIRFKDYVDDWEQRKLGDVSERVRGNDGRMDLPTLTISAGRGWLDQRERFSENIAGQEQKNYTLLSKGDLSYNHGNSKIAKYGVVFKLRNYEEALVPRVYHSFYVTEDASSDFIEYMFATKRPDRELAKLISSGARMDGLLNINYDDFMGINVMCPSVDEQRRIASFLRKMDSTIILYQRKCEQLQTFKKMMLKKMFPEEGCCKPAFRFEGFTDAWEQRKVSDIAEIVSGGTPDTNNLDYWNGDINWYAPAEISDQIYVTESERKITELGLQKSSAKMLPAEKTILFTSRAGIGKVAILKQSACTNQGFQSLVVKDGYEPYFIYSMGNQLKEKAESIASGSTFLEISGKMLANLHMKMPRREEQLKIASFFQELDTLITLHQRKSDKLVEVKKYMLKNMFV